ncbi:Uncharacterized protein DAT39_014540 [Clarias magur]|uniref:Uncharacterized protein n=1 Tax=Clarias magur TaxID=1594786 RepID=A0A8J4UHZ2_CLAMG|nr:Uncharacterized protein DAT39_014540 [Clarias magur]
MNIPDQWKRWTGSQKPEDLIKDNQKCGQGEGQRWSCHVLASESSSLGHHPQ